MSDTALLLMDLQNVIVERIGNDPAYLDRVHNVLAAARQAKMTIIYVVVKFRPDFPEVSPRNKSFSLIKSGGLPITEGDPATEITASLAPQPTDIVVTKRRVGAFSGSDLDVVLRSQGIEHIVLTGLSTSGVVLSTLRLAADLDYQITVIADCCADRDEEVHRVLTEKVFPNQADVVKADHWIKTVIAD
ncbi:MAG: cysteine hydrolase [Candidatus Obscuribacterales bacterium]|nr:cysteine hydrolase [Candidatus Obscuribacterales bacterium]